MALDNSIFKRPAKEYTYKLTVNTEGLERSGKTNFIMSMPGTIGIIALDRNTENVAIKYQKLGKSIYLADFCDPNPKTNPLAKHVLPTRAEPSKGALKPEAKAPRNFYEARWDAIQQAYYNMVENKDINSLSIDSGTQLYEDCRLALFGKLQQIPPMKYGECNALLREFISASSKCNLVVTHKLGKLYVGNDWKGEYEAKGWSDMSYMCQITLRHSTGLIKDPDAPGGKRYQFKAVLEDCNQDASLRGTELTDEDITFSTLGSLVYPDAPAEVWV